MELPGYDRKEVLHEDTARILLRARSADGRPVLLRLPRGPGTSPRQIARCQLAFDLGRQADPLSVARPLEILRLPGGGVGLVYEDPGATVLARVIPPGGLRLAPLIHLAPALARALARLHASGILHRDVTPAHLVVDEQKASARFIDLDVGTRLRRELGATPTLRQIEGTLAYLSPEQCGRLDSPVDDRADLYSLGITLFELASGRLPFEQQDAASLVHAQVALAPPLLSLLRPALPAPFCAIVERLLRKNVEERYASAAGLLRDLERCATEFERSGTVRPFALGTDDVSPLFRLPDRLYGRDPDIASLEAAWAEACRGRRTLACVAGPSGIGKTALVGRLRGPVASHGGRLAAGKFDQFKRDQPYLPFVEAVRSLLRRELAEGEARLEPRRRTLQAALGRHGRLLTDVLPELHALVGEQPDIDPVAPAEAARRFNGVVARFLGVFADEQAPLLLFLDDLQWADPASLNLLEALAKEPGLRHLMIVIGYRSNELAAGHPSRRALEQMSGEVESVLQIELGPLSASEIAELVGDALHAEGEAIGALAEHVHRVSAGNAYFARELLGALHERGCFGFDRTLGRWRLALEQLPQSGVPDDLASFLTARLGGLPARTLELLESASCIGSAFDLRTLARVHEIRQSEAAADLGPAVTAGLLLPLGSAYKSFEALAAWQLDPEEADGFDTARYRFQHDQVRQAVHQRLDERQRAERHLRIGRLLLRSLSPEEIEADVVELFNHLAGGVALISDAGERLDHAQLGLRAGRKALRGLAFETARSQLEVALALLPEDAWGEAYETTLGIHLALAECAFALGDTERLEALARHVLEQVHDPVDAARMHGLRIRFLSTETRYEEAVDICVEVARELGVSLPRRPRPYHLLYAVARVLRAQAGKTPEALEDLPECQDPALREAVNLLAQAAGAAYFAEPALLPLIGITCTRLSIERGLNPASPYGLAVWALVLCGVLGRIETGYRFGQLATTLGRRYGGAEEARARFVVGAFVRHWKEPLARVSAGLLEDWRLNRDAGDEESAVYCGGVLLYTEFLAGTPLEADRRHEEVVRYIAASHKPHVQASFLAWVQLFEALRAQELPDELAGSWFDYPAQLPGFELTRNGVQIAIASLAAGILDHLAGRYERAERRFELAARWEANIVGQVLVPGLAFFRGLNAYRLAAGHGGAASLRLARRQARRVRRWARHAPANLSHRLSLLDAEDLLRRGRANDAIVTLHRAVGEAASGGAPLYQALAERRIAELFSQLGDAHSAELAAWRAGGHFESWGAPAAARALRYGAGTLAGAGPQARFALPEEGGGTGELDLKSLIEAVGAISSELDDDVLLGRLMHTTLRAANADRGLMILLDKDDSPRIEIEARDDAQSQQSGVALDDCPAVARGIVELALRTQRTVVVQDAARDELTAADPHVLRSRVRAILAVCVSRRGRTVGVMYLENEIARGAFRPDRVELAEALAAEAAVALENARLHRSTQEALDAQVRLTEANRRFVPEQILSSLGFDSIVGVNLNEARERPMSVLFADLRGFTRLSAEIGPKRTIELVNRYLAHVQPGIAANRGFVANYFGDGLLALFPGSAEDALHGAVAMSRGLQGYNRHRGALPPLRFGLGIHSGAVILGTIGDPDHLQCSVMGDTVNVAARVEELTKHFGATLLLSGDAQEGLSTPEAVALRSLGQVRVAGRDAPLAVFECLDALPELLRERLLAGRDDFERAVALYCEGRWSAAAALFAASVRHCPDDAVSRGFEERCRLRTEAAGDWAGDWDGVERVEKALT